jgi:hypothetical protein
VFRSAPLSSLSRVDDLLAISLRSRATVIGPAAPNFFCCTRATLATVYTSKSARASAALLSSPPFLRGRLRIICSSCCSRGSGRDGRPEIEGGNFTAAFRWATIFPLARRVLLSKGHRLHRRERGRRRASIPTVKGCDGWPAGPAPDKSLTQASQNSMSEIQGHLDLLAGSRSGRAAAAPASPSLETTACQSRS